MNLVYDGKTKAVYSLPDGNYLMKFKDDATGENGVFDPGANTVGLTIEGLGISDLRLSEFFFAMLNEKGVPTHYVSSDAGKAEMVVRPAQTFGKGLEVICRLRAVGSFMRRYGAYADNGQKLDYLVEFTLKDDERGDPPITQDTLEMLGILNKGEYGTLKSLTKQICGYIAESLAAKGMELYDIKFEFGRINGSVALIDEISAGSMRVFKDGKKVEPLELSVFLLGS